MTKEDKMVIKAHRRRGQTLKKVSVRRRRGWPAHPRHTHTHTHPPSIHKYLQITTTLRVNQEN